MCMGGGAPKMPAVETPPPPPEPAKAADQAVQQARTDERRRARQAAGQNGTILTGSGGDLTTANTGAKSLLGS